MQNRNFTGWMTGTSVNLSMLSVLPTSGGIDKILEIFTSGAMALLTQYMVMKWADRRAEQKRIEQEKKKQDENSDL
jgi:hypothetical protein